MTRDQTCPCGVTEAAGSYCTKCLAPTQESWLHRGKGNPDALRAYRAAKAGSLTESPHTEPERAPENDVAGAQARVAVKRAARVAAEELHPGQLSSAREPSINPADERGGAPVCRAGARGSERGRRARAAYINQVSTLPSGPRGYALRGPDESAGPEIPPSRGPDVLRLGL